MLQLLIITLNQIACERIYRFRAGLKTECSINITTFKLLQTKHNKNSYIIANQIENLSGNFKLVGFRQITNLNNLMQI